LEEGFEADMKKVKEKEKMFGLKEIAKVFGGQL